MGKSQKYVFHLAGLKWIVEHTEADAQAIILDKRELDNKDIFTVVDIQTFPNENPYANIYCEQIKPTNMTEAASNILHCIIY